MSYATSKEPGLTIEVLEGRYAEGRYVNQQGYAKVLRGLTWVSEHQILMEESLGRPLLKGESVHHKNGVRDDNRPENLELWVSSIRHGQRAGQRAADIFCLHCGASYLVGR